MLLSRPLVIFLVIGLILVALVLSDPTEISKNTRVEEFETDKSSDLKVSITEHQEEKGSSFSQAANDFSAEHPQADKQDKSWLASQLFNIKNNLALILSKNKLTEEDKADVKFPLEQIFKDNSISRKEKIELIESLWVYANQNPEGLLLLEQSIINYKPKELTGLMLTVLTNTGNEEVYISTLDLLRESHSAYYATGRYDLDYGEKSDAYQEEEILSFINSKRFDSELAKSALQRARHQFSPVKQVQTHWVDVLTSDLSEGDSVDAVDDFMSMLLARKKDQTKILQAQLQNFDSMNGYTRERLKTRLSQIKDYEADALADEASDALSQFLGEES